MVKSDFAMTEAPDWNADSIGRIQGPVTVSWAFACSAGFQVAGILWRPIGSAAHDWGLLAALCFAAMGVWLLYISWRELFRFARTVPAEHAAAMQKNVRMAVALTLLTFFLAFCFSLSFGAYKHFAGAYLSVLIGTSLLALTSCLLTTRQISSLSSPLSPAP
jgi:hypothetical protein